MPLVAWAATCLEATLGVALIAGVLVRWAAFGSAALLAWFAIAKATAGLKSPLDYSVFSASAGALLLAVAESRPNQGRRSMVADGAPRRCGSAIRRGAFSASRHPSDHDQFSRPRVDPEPNRFGTCASNSRLPRRPSWRCQQCIVMLTTALAS
jgi:hypothetical protein